MFNQLNNLINIIEYKDLVTSFGMAGDKEFLEILNEFMGLIRVKSLNN